MSISVPTAADASADARLEAVVDAVLGAPRLGERELFAILRRHPKAGRGFYRKREILEAFRRRGAGAEAEAAFAERLRTCPTRSLSGILPVTVLTRPFPCPGRCVFCPSDVRMPKSYVASEPGCRRAEANRFDPYLQAWSRLDAYRRMGHATDKVELLVLGGTWSFYPEPYQRWFAARCLEALNDFGAGRDGRAAVREHAPDFAALARAGGADDAAGRYNARVAAFLRDRQEGALVAPWESASWAELAAAQRANESAACRCVGLSVETRPDCVDAAELVRLRRLGVTKVQVGVQSLDDAVLRANGRGHDVAATRRALAGLRAAGFKLQLHWMPNLLGADPGSDRRDFARLFADPAVGPDELKVYPCSLLESAELVRFAERGDWRPYGHETLVALLADCLAQVPRWCRVTRVIRDIPSPEILVGNRQTNLREPVEARLRAEGRALVEMRAREIRGAPLDPRRLRLRETARPVAGGEERFLEWVTGADRLAAFARVFLPGGAAAGPPVADAPAAPAELSGCALLREVHVYGTAAALGERAVGKAQHTGLGRRLVAAAAERARAHGCTRLAVISAVGTRGWYRRLGFVDGALYQHLPLGAAPRQGPAGGADPAGRPSPRV